MQEASSCSKGTVLSLFEERSLQMGNIRCYKYVNKISFTRFISPQTKSIIVKLMKKNLKKLKVANSFWFFPRTSPTVYPEQLMNFWRLALLPRLSRHFKVLKGYANFAYLKEFKNLKELDIASLDKKFKVPHALKKLKTLEISNINNASKNQSMINIYRINHLENLKIQGHYSDICSILKRWENSRFQTNANLIISLSRFDPLNNTTNNPITTTTTLQFPLSSKISSLSGNNQNNFSIFPLIALQFMKMPNLKVFRYIDIFKSVSNFNFQNAKLESLRDLKSLQNLSLNLSHENRDLSVLATLDDLYLAESLEALQLVIELPDSGVSKDYKNFNQQLEKLVNLKEFEFVARSPSSLRDPQIAGQMLELLFKAAGMLPRKEILKALKIRIQGVAFSPRDGCNQSSVERLMTDLKDFNSLESLTLHTNTKYVRGEVSPDMIQNWSRLRSLSLNLNYLDEGAFVALMSCPKLDSLVLDMHSFVSREDFMVYAKIISQKLKNLTYLEVIFNEITGMNLENYKEVSESLKELFQSLEKLRDCFLCLNELVLPSYCADSIGDVFKWRKFISTCVLQTQYWSLYKNHLQNGSYTVKVATQTVL